MHILLVDDDYLLAQSMAKLIESLANHQVTITDDPLTIFAECRSGHIDLVMMDIKLPGIFWEGGEISGVEISKLLKSNPKTASIPIILVTAYPILSKDSSLLSISEADSFVPKPIRDYPAFLGLMERLYQEKNNIKSGEKSGEKSR